MQWLIDIVIEAVLNQLPNLVSLNAIEPTSSQFAHGTGSTWAGVTGSAARDAIGLGVADSVEFGQLDIDLLTLNSNVIESSSGQIDFAANDLTNIEDLTCLGINSGDIDCHDINAYDVTLSDDLILNGDTPGIALGWAGPVAGIDYRSATTGTIVLRSGTSPRAQLWSGTTSAVLNLWDNVTQQARIASDAIANVQAYFALGRVGIGTKTPQKLLDVAGDISLQSGSGAYHSNDGSQGWTGTFTEHTGKTVTVKQGIVTSVA